MKKRGVSPVIATVLLVSLVLILASIISLWSRGFLIKETIFYEDRNIELVCEDVKFSASYQDTLITVLNNGNIPLENFQIRKTSANGDYSIVELEGETSIKQGSSGNFILAETLEGYEEIFVIPILLGQLEGVDTTYVCDKRHGVEAYAK